MRVEQRNESERVELFPHLFAYVGMTQACLPAIVRVTVHREPSGIFVAQSPDLPGPIAVELDERRLAQAVPQRIQAWFQAEGCAVRVLRGEGRVAALSAWNVVRLEADGGDPVPRPNPPPPLPPSIDPSRPEGHPPPPPPIPVPDLPPPGRPPPRDPDPTR